jgi:hypothetical protein
MLYLRTALSRPLLVCFSKRANRKVVCASKRINRKVVRAENFLLASTLMSFAQVLPGEASSTSSRRTPGSMRPAKPGVKVSDNANRDFALHRSMDPGVRRGDSLVLPWQNLKLKLVCFSKRAHREVVWLDKRANRKVVCFLQNEPRSCTAPNLHD